MSVTENLDTLTEDLKILESETGIVEGFEPSGSDEKHYYIRGKFATIETINNNKRIYPRSLWEREVAKYQSEIENGTINTLMEWDHPKDRLDVDPSKAIAKITKLWIEGDYVMGEAVIFDVPMAETLKSMIKYGVQISVSSRARGRTDSSGVVQEFNLITFDFVAKPSDKSATMYGIFENEHYEEELMNYENDSVLESLAGMVRTKNVIIDDLNEEIEYLRDRLAEERALNEGDVLTVDLDYQHDIEGGFEHRRREEESDLIYRRAADVLSQDHRHQDVHLLKDSDPASSYYSGEAESVRILQLLSQAFGRDKVVGTLLGQDVDTGHDVSGYSSSVNNATRAAEYGREVDGSHFYNGPTDITGGVHSGWIERNAILESEYLSEADFFVPKKDNRFR